jgi:hypothetical protein
MKYIITMALVALAGCEDRYRYSCQDPANYHQSQCQPPACEANGTCTKYLLKGTTNEV